MKKRKGLIFFALLVLTVLFLYCQNNWIDVTRIDIKDDKIPAAFNGYKILQLSDLHGKTFGKEQAQLIQKIEKQNPDIIVFTGDLVDSKDTDFEPGLVLLKRILSIAPVLYVTGNHEWWSGCYDRMDKALAASGVQVLHNRVFRISKEKEALFFIGVDDPAGGEQSAILSGHFSALIAETQGYRILLSHRPELFKQYAENNVDLIFSGHAHGGQFRLPFLGGLVAPNQGFFPKYTAGLYEMGQTKMIVNRGLGNSIIPQRLFNRPEITLCTLFN